MGLLTEQIWKAKRRLDFDPQKLRDSLRKKTPKDLSSSNQLEQRHDFLRNSMGDDRAAKIAFERIIDGNELMSINYLERGTHAARSVARVHMVSETGNTLGWGTGFLIAPCVFITNNHVLSNVAISSRSEAHFEYERDVRGNGKGPTIFKFRPDQLFFTSQDLDFSVIAMEPTSSRRCLSEFGVLPFIGKLGKVLDGEWLTIIQHPNGERKQVCVRDNRLLHRAEDVLWYSTDTLGGSSGSPVFNNDWFVVALHHSGIPAERNGRIQTRDGRDYDEETMDETQIHWIANEGIRTSRIVDCLEQALPSHPLLQPIFLPAPVEASLPNLSPSFQPILQPLQTLSTIQPITVPIHLHFTLSPQSGELAASKNTAATPIFEVRPQTTRRRPILRVNGSGKRKGFDENFLDTDYKIWLPELSPGIANDAIKLLDGTGRETHETVLKYTHFSVSVSKSRCFAFYSAANVHFAQRWELGFRENQWLWDDRIPRKYQLDNWFYVNNNFDRGHLTRYKDVQWGTSAEEAAQGAEDSCHWTNCVPMHLQFNRRGDEAPLWFELEQYILEDCIQESRFKAQVITGPVLRNDDPEYKGVQYPVSFWKIVAAINSKKKLFATAYLLSQAGTLEKFGIESASEVPFSKFEIYQTSLSKIESLTGLRFQYGTGLPLSEVDPMREDHRPVPECRRVSHPEALTLA